MDKTDLIKFIKSKIPKTSIELETDGNVGLFNQENYEILFDEILIIIKLYVRTKGVTTEASNYTPREYEETHKCIDIIIKELYIDEQSIQIDNYLDQNLISIIKNTIEY